MSLSPSLGNLIANHSYKVTLVDLYRLIGCLREHLNQDNIQANALLGRVCLTVFNERCIARTAAVVHGYLLEEFLRECIVALHNNKRLEAPYSANKAVDTALNRAYTSVTSPINEMYATYVAVNSR